jgi:excisionase family DNA binding protein
MMETLMTKSNASEGDAYTVLEAAQRMRLHPIDVADLIFDGELKCVSNGRVTRIPTTEVTRFVEEQRAVESVVMKCIEMAVRKGVMEKVSQDKNTTFRFKRARSVSE